MAQPPRDTHRMERERSGRRHALFGLLGAAAISIATFFVLTWTDAPPPSSPPRLVGGELVVQAVAGDQQAIRTLGGRLVLDSKTTISGQLDPSGSLRFAYLTSGPATLDLEAAGFARLRQAVRLGSGRRILTVVMEPGAEVLVRVTDEQGKPLSNVDVSLWPRSATNEPSHAGAKEADAIRASTDQQGEALMEGVPHGMLSASAILAGHEPVAALVFESPRADPLTLVLPRTARINGFLTQADGTPAAGTVVIAGSGVWPPREIDVGATGQFAIDGLTGGVYELHGAGPDTVAEPVEGLAVEPGETASATLVLGPAAEIVVRVIDASSGRPIAGASVLVGEDTMALAAATITTDATGQATLGGLRPRPYRLSASATGYVPHPGSDHVPGVQPVTLHLIAAAEIRGEVVDPDGRPISGATIDIIGDTQAGAALAMTRGSLTFRSQLFGSNAAGALPIARSDNLGVTTGPVPPIPVDARLSLQQPGAPESAAHATGLTSDTNGHFTLLGIPPGTVQVVASQPGWAIGRSPSIRTKPGGRIDGVRVVLKRGGRISGRVVDDADFPLAAVTVDLACADDPTPRSATTDAAGQFELGGALGDCTVTALPRGLPPARAQIQVVDGTVHELTLKVAGTTVRISARVVDAGGFPVVGAAVQVRGTDPTQPTLGAGLSGADGSVEVGELGRPPYQVDVSHPGFAPLHLRDVHETTDLRWVLQAGAVVRGIVSTDSDRTPLVGARVELRGKASEDQRATRAGALGMFEIHNVIAGNYELIISHPQTTPKRRTVHVSARDVVRGELDLGETVTSQAGSVSGTVVDRLGAPVASARVFSGDIATATDSEGRFLLAGLPPGIAAVGSSHPSAGNAVRSANIKVYAGQETPEVRLQLDGRFVPAEPEATDPAESEEPPETERQPVSRGTGVAVEVATGRGGVMVTSVMAGSAAERAGVRVGDLVTAIDGEPVSIAGQVRSMLRGEVDTPVVLEVSRAGRRQRIKLRRERY